VTDEKSLLKAYCGVMNTRQKGSTPVKILVGYIKPSFLFKNDILTPIHLGRATAREISKDGVISDEDYDWLLQNMPGDDDFDGNISRYNRRIGFLTGTYWARKNYKKLGNPEYFGFFGYRKFLAPEFLKDITEYDFIVPKQLGFGVDLRKQFIDCHGTNSYNVILKVIDKLYPEKINALHEYFARTSGYFHEMYVLKQDIFFEFCDWVFPIVFALLNTNLDEFIVGAEERAQIIYRYDVVMCRSFICNDQNFEHFQKRVIGFIMERLTGFFLFELTKKSKLKYIEADIIQTDIARDNEMVAKIAKQKYKLDVVHNRIGTLRKRVSRDLK
jgi:hypothetical protein